MIRALLADDEELSRRALHQLLARHSDVANCDFMEYELLTKENHPVMVYQTSPTREWDAKCNCHGYTFLHGDYWIMNSQVERRKSNRVAEDAVSPEYLAMLAVCGGDIRESDKPALAERRRPAPESGRRISDRRPVALR